MIKSVSCKVLIVLTLTCIISTALALQDYETKRAFPRDCDSGYSITCFKLDIIQFIDKMAETKEYGIMSGLTVVRESGVINDTKNGEIVAEMSRSFPNDPDRRLNGFLLAKVSNYLQSHSLRLKLFDAKDVEEARSAFEGRKGGGGLGGGGGGKGGKKGGGMEGLLAAALMMKSMMMALGLGALALLAGKALMTALLALMLSAIIGLKSLLSGGHKQTTYEIVAKPIYSNTHSSSSSHEDYHGGHGGGGGHSGYGGYGRSLNFALPEHLTKE